eukprot:CAMPEP_0181324436 /NCGR_PEP_ID=MMETSP1101-20121128/20358_1 /TAXON_ID=46948 /ORGANISM="Rhodomonas abbreviata, Strain Caron Lab Isolate" /LENGTH=181 /DNA_ID=CAMNT_0023432611 /DNA_START=675 /DNA_END=1220 /DNA_ORIENTATION=-
MKQMRTFVFDMLEVALVRFMGPVGTMTAFVKGGLVTMVPPNAHELASGRLTVAYTSLQPTPKGVRETTWRSKEDLVNCCLASCYIPVYYEEPIEYAGCVCVDAGLTDNQPVTSLDTVTVSPFSTDDAVIKPTQAYPTSFSLVPGSRADMEAIYWDGYTAAVAFMASEGWLSDSDSFDLVDS